MMEFQFNSRILNGYQREFNKLDPIKRLTMSHYELAKATSIDDEEGWKSFLTNPKVKDWISQELDMLKEMQLRKLISNATNNDKSVGSAQMINALSKTVENTSKEGNMFIYSYVPLNEKEQTAPNTAKTDKDIFNKE